MTRSDDRPADRSPGQPPDLPPDWPSDWLRASLGLCVLRVVADGPTYGYAITVRLAEAGLGQVKGGTLYPLLSRYEAAGLVVTEWTPGDGGPGRKYYRLTDAGRAALETESARWTRFTDTTTALLRPATAPQEGSR